MSVDPSSIGACSKSAIDTRHLVCTGFRGTSLTRKRTHLGPYRRPMPRVLVGSQDGGRFLMGEVPLSKRLGWGGG